MALVVEIAPATDTLEQLQQRLRGKESAGFELVALGRGLAGGQMANLATYMRLELGDVPPPMTLMTVAGSQTSAQQSATLTAGETAGKRLVSYAGVFVGGQEANVAVYRG